MKMNKIIFHLIILILIDQIIIKNIGEVNPISLLMCSILDRNYTFRKHQFK